MNTEKIILNSLLNNNKTFDLISSIEITDFEKTVNQFLFKLIMQYYNKNGFIPTQDILCKLIKDTSIENKKVLIAYVNTIYEIKEVKDVQFYINDLLKNSQQRKLLVTLSTASDLYKQNKVEECLNFIYKNTGKSLAKLASNYLREGDYIAGFENRLRNMIVRKFGKESNKIFSVPIGIPQFDKRFSGLMPGEFGIVTGGTGKGKSIMLLNFAAHAYLNGFNVVIITIEMPKIQYEYRMDSRLCQLSNKRFRMADLTSKDIREWKDKINILKENHKNIIWTIDIPSSATVSIIKEKLLSIKNIIGENYLLIIDYLNLLKPADKRLSPKSWEAQAEISMSIKEMARELNVPTWSAAQLTKKAANVDNYDTLGTAYSNAINENIDFALTLVQTQSDLLDGVIRLINTKGREGKCDETILHPNLDNMIMITDNKDREKGNE